MRSFPGFIYDWAQDQLDQGLTPVLLIDGDQPIRAFALASYGQALKFTFSPDDRVRARFLSELIIRLHNRIAVN